jgi:hypothetical protein
MKIRCPLFPLFLILVTLLGLIIWIGERTISEAAQSENIKDFAQYDPPLRIAEDVLTRLGKGTVQNREGAQRAVDSGLNIILPKLLEGDEKHAQELGFQTGKDTIGIIKNSAAFPVFEIHLNDLLTFSPGKDVRQFLFYTSQLLLPIGVDNRVQSSLTIRFTLNESGGIEQKRVGRTWRPTRWGQPHLIHQLTTAQNQFANQKPGFLVSIPALNRNFLGYEENTVIKLVPLVRDRLFEKIESLSAEDAFGRLSAEAMSMDDAPR